MREMNKQKIITHDKDENFFTTLLNIFLFTTMCIYKFSSYQYATFVLNAVHDPLEFHKEHEILWQERIV